MAELTLKRRRKDYGATELRLNIQNQDNGEIQTYVYKVRHIGGKAAMKLQLMKGQFAKEKDRDEIIGSRFLNEVLSLTKPVDANNNLDFLDIFDLLEDGDEEGAKGIISALIDAATSTTVTTDEVVPTAQQQTAQPVFNNPNQPLGA